jgi:hypothetical protein
MDENWRPVEVFVPSGLTAHEVRVRAYSAIRVIVRESGEFVDTIRIGVGIHQADGRCKWSAHFLPGSPGVFRNQLLE